MTKSAPREVYAVVCMDNSEKILIKPLRERGKWYFPGGLLKRGQDPVLFLEELIHREIGGIKLVYDCMLGELTHDGIPVEIYLFHAEGWPDRHAGMDAANFVKDFSPYPFSSLGRKIMNLQDEHFSRAREHKKPNLIGSATPS